MAAGRARAGLVHREVGVVASILGRVVAWPAKAMPTLAVDAHLPGRKGERPDRAASKRFAIAWARRGLLEVFAEDDELVAGHPPQGVPRPEHATERCADRDQQVIADAVTVGVVDRLEPFEVEEQQRSVVFTRPPRPKARPSRSSISAGWAGRSTDHVARPRRS